MLISRARILKACDRQEDAMITRVVQWSKASLVLPIVLAGPPAPAVAQGTTAAIQGTIIDATGPLPGANITARDVQSGFTYQAVSDSQGGFNLSGLRPASYDIAVAMNQYKPQARTVQVLAGQTVTVNFKIDPDVIYTESVEVVGNSRLVQTRTAEISTSVTTEQIRYLPQNQRNFLNFAALAPGARVSDNETRKQVTAGGLDATQINVFIDGVSYKNDVLDGGVVGQDSSRGSPFPQTAVQEFQVLTQNYKAEHDVWGMTASDSQKGYVAWGGPPRHKDIDGSVVPAAAAGSLMLAPDVALPAVREIHRRFGHAVFARYGFADAFHPTTGWINPDVIGIDLGITLLSAENLRTGRIWTWFMKNPEITTALERAGVTSRR
jgi:hypothetical protein